MLCVTSTNDPIDTYAGRLGLGRTGSSYTGQLYVNQLKSAGVITEKKFSLSFDSKTNISKIDFGPVDKAERKAGQQTIAINMIGTSNPYWQGYFDGFYFGDGVKTKYTTELMAGIIDSGVPTISGPKVNIDFIKKWVTKNMTEKTVDAVDGTIFFSCSKYFAGLPSLFFRLGGYWLEALPKDYAVVSSGDTCRLLLSESEDYWSIGLPILRGYYTTFDITNDQVLFAAQTDSAKASPLFGPAPTVADGTDPVITPLNDPDTSAVIKPTSGSNNTVNLTTE